jgi:hypothetical protein
MPAGSGSSPRHTSARRVTIVVATAGMVSVLIPVTAATASGTTQRSRVISQHNRRTAPPLTGTTERRSDNKTARAEAYLDGVQANWQAAAAGRAAPYATVATPPRARVLGIGNYRIQRTENWCGPTSLTVIADFITVMNKSARPGQRWSRTDDDLSQEQHAANLVLDRVNQGTDWIGRDSVPLGGSWVSSYPMQDALNYLLRHTRHKLFYAVKSLPGRPTIRQKRAFRAALVYDVNFAHGYPMAANEYATPDHFLPGQSSRSGMIMHWVVPTGYTQSGARTVYEDPGWGSGAPQNVRTGFLVTAIGGRGYVF